MFGSAKVQNNSIQFLQLNNKAQKPEKKTDSKSHANLNVVIL